MGVEAYAEANRLDSPETLQHHVVIRGIEKPRIVDDETDRRNFVRRRGALAEETRTPIYAWALMSNHAQLLLCSGALGLAKFMRRLLPLRGDIPSFGCGSDAL